MGRHIIINMQRGDLHADFATTHLAAKPIKNQWHERRIVALDRLQEMEFDAADKVYLVGHGGEKTLGGLTPEQLASNVSRSLQDVGQINLVMCGGDDPRVRPAQTFKNRLADFGCTGKVYAYAADLSVDKDGKKHARIFEVVDTGTDLKVETTTVPAQNVKVEVLDTRAAERDKRAAEDL